MRSHEHEIEEAQKRLRAHGVHPHIATCDHEQVCSPPLDITLHQLRASHQRRTDVRTASERTAQEVQELHESFLPSRPQRDLKVLDIAPAREG